MKGGWVVSITFSAQNELISIYEAEESKQMQRFL